MSHSFDCIIIGGDVNGLSAATTMARAGRRVVLLEEHDFLGGIAASQQFGDGFNHTGTWFDTSQVRPQAVQELQLEKYGLRRESACASLFLPSPHNRGILIGEASLNPDDLDQVDDDVKQYTAYRQFVARIAPFMTRLFDKVPVTEKEPGWQDLWQIAKTGMSLRRLGREDMLEVLRINLLCAADWLNEWFASPLLKAGLAGPAIFASNTGPWSPGNNLNLVRWESQRQPMIQGGAPALVTALKNAALDAGVDLRLSNPIKHINLDRDKVRGVTLDNGDTLTATQILAACHPKPLFTRLIAPEHMPLKLQQAVDNYRSLGSTAVLHMALDKPPKSPHRTDWTHGRARLVDTLDNMERAFDATKYRTAADLPWLDLQVSQDDAANTIATAWVHHVPYGVAAQWDQKDRDAYQHQVYKVLDTYFPGLSQTVLADDLLLPEDLESRYGLSGGHLTMGEQAVDQLLVRPFLEANRYATPFSGLFLCGDASRPGGGLSCMPGLLGAKAALDNG